MLKAIPGCETVQHLCEYLEVGMQRIKLEKPRAPVKGIQILMHDINPYIFLESTKQTIHITYCPYCGADIDKEERP
ncbi:hypothetical protein LJC32_01270 [Oscillospiraceae bacterium OttesenSCG-928-F05]|nr:hypothetical protein [Oscillospiraceae bacterium OttesenSCG-928-F05]